MTIHKTKVDPLQALYIEKTPEQKDADEKLVLFFRYLLKTYTLEDLLR
jgi:hypothetical protein